MLQISESGKNYDREYDNFPDHVAVDEGNDVMIYPNLALHECKQLCDEFDPCNSFAYAPDPGYPLQNCYLKDKVITASDQFIYKKYWTTFYLPFDTGNFYIAFFCTIFCLY